MGIDPTGYSGAMGPANTSSQYNATEFIFQQLMGKIGTATLVEVMACTNAGSLVPAGTVDVKILVHQVDGQGLAVPHDTIFSVPYCRYQAGSIAVVLDPQVGDIGLIVVGDRDLSVVKGTFAAALPGSQRRNDLSDSIYVMGLLNQDAITTYLRFDPVTGIHMRSPVAITLNAPMIGITAPIVTVSATTSVTVTTPTLTLNGSLVVTGTGSFAGNVTGGGKSLDTHTHLENGTGHQTNPPT